MKHLPKLPPIVLVWLFFSLVFAAVAAPLGVPSGAKLPPWPKPLAPAFTSNSPSIQTRDLELVHSPDVFGSFVVRVAGKDFAVGQNRALIGYLNARGVQWFDLGAAAHQKTKVRSHPGTVLTHWEGNDPDGAHWLIEQEFRPGSIPNAIDIQTEVVVDQDRDVIFLPMLMIFPGSGSFGSDKGQGLFAGLEYLENEPSSSEADVTGPAARRQVPNVLKITFPLMAIQNEHRFLALVWEMGPQFSAVFDSPDRLFSSSGHVMGIIYPGSNGKNRLDGDLLPRTSERLVEHTLLQLRATILGGTGETVVPAIEQYVKLRGLPQLPEAPGLQQYVSMASGGWLNSSIRNGNLIRHAVAEGNFAPGPAADAAAWMDWLASNARDQGLAAPLRTIAADVIAVVPTQSLYNSGVGHIRYPLAPLVFGHVPESLQQADAIAREVLTRFEPDGTLVYHPRPGGPDYAKTHFSHEATGFTSRAVEDLLEAARFTGDRELIDAALKRLDAMNKFRSGVPRGAQTWECPLHTPDILAAAQMVRAYTLGYELTGNSDYLDQAAYWAWTGVPFVYLANPTSQAVGTYSTIAVFGATHWEAPVWLGLPVQWCGLVYADALYGLAQHDGKGPWKKLADGITISGIQQSWPSDNRELQGLLPDSFVLTTQHRNGPAINPATVQACAARYFGFAAYDSRCYRQAGLRVHAPGAIKDIGESKKQLRFSINSWVEGPYFVLINGLEGRPRLKLDGREAVCSAPHEFIESKGQLILELTGKKQVELSF